MVPSSFTILALSSLLCLSLGQNTGDTCDQNTFQTCASALGDQLGTPYTSLFNDNFLPDALYARFVATQTLTDFAKVCNYLNTFYQCLVPTFDQCLGPLGWVAAGKSPAQAYQNDGVFRLYAFMCGAGFELLNDKPTFDCVRTTFANNYDALYNNTMKAYQSSVAYNPSSACTYSELLQVQWAAIVSNTTCYSARREHVASFFGCGSALQYTYAQFRHCAHQNTCKWTARWTNTRKYLKEESGVKYLLIPEHHTRDDQGEWFLAPDKWIELH